jgi:hypothetical protein
MMYWQTGSARIGLQTGERHRGRRARVTSSYIQAPRALLITALLQGPKNASLNLFCAMNTCVHVDAEEAYEEGGAARPGRGSAGLRMRARHAVMALACRQCSVRGTRAGSRTHCCLAE